MRKSTIVSLLLAVIVTFFAVGACFAAGTGQHPEQIGPAGLRPDVSTVLAALEHRTGDKRLLEKAGHKLTGMSERRLRLAVSLSVHADDKSTGVENDIAFLLLATLIVFS